MLRHAKLLATMCALPALLAVTAVAVVLLTVDEGREAAEASTKLSTVASLITPSGE